MRHSRWLEFMKDYDFGLSYHPGKSNFVVDALSHKTFHMSTLMARNVEADRRVQRFEFGLRSQGVECEVSYVEAYQWYS